MRSVEIRQRVDRLIRYYQQYLGAFDEAPAFTKAGQFEKHAAAIRLRGSLGTASAAIADDEFLRLLRLTLVAWGIGSRGSQLLELGEFIAEIRAHVREIEELESKTIDDPELDIYAVSTSLWRNHSVVFNRQERYQTCAVYEGAAPFSAGPSCSDGPEVHPDLFRLACSGIPISTRTNLSSRLGEFVCIARATDPVQYVGNGWRTSRTKVLDNALVGFCRVEHLPLPS